MEDFKKRYQTILEYVSNDDMFIDEAEDEEAQDQEGGMLDMGADMGGDMAQQDANAPMPDMGGENAEAQAPEGFNPDLGVNAPEGDGLPGMDGSEIPQDANDVSQVEPEQPGDEVIDVEELTDSQEDTEKKIDLMSDRFEKLFQKLDDFESRLDASNERIDTIKTEIEKRNPTPVEKLTLRSKNAYPFNVSPDQYWEEKEETSNYSTEDDNNGADDVTYQITKSDIDNISDWENISKSMDTKKVGLLDILDF